MTEALAKLKSLCSSLISRYSRSCSFSRRYRSRSATCWVRVRTFSSSWAFSSSISPAWNRCRYSPPTLSEMPEAARLQRCGDHREQLGGERSQAAGHGCPQHERAQHDKYCRQDLEFCTLEEILHPWGPPVNCGNFRPDMEIPLIKQNTTSSTAK